MKSNVQSRPTCRARSDRKMAAPLSTPTKMMDSPAKSFVICVANSATRFAMSSREISTLSSAMAFHIKLGGRFAARNGFSAQLDTFSWVGIYESERHQADLVGAFHFSY